MYDLNEKAILVTGGTGSFGSRFVELVLKELNPRKLIIYSRDELKQFQMQQVIDDPRVTFVIGDVRDKDRLRSTMAGVDVVVHAAALKQVPTAERHPTEAIKTNILGASSVIESAIANGVERVVALSTDKAANPVNMYGATKMVADKLFLAANADQSVTRFALVRYGNVVGSRGSVVPLFLEQKRTGVLSITDPRMTRFWITLEQGVRFVLRSLRLMHGGEVFVPKLPTAAIMDLAAAIAPDCRIEHIGIRPGEKLHEVLVPADEAYRTLELDDSFVITPEPPGSEAGPWAHGKPVPDGFRYASDTNPWRLTVDEIRTMLKELGYDLTDSVQQTDGRAGRSTGRRGGPRQ